MTDYGHSDNSPTAFVSTDQAAGGGAMMWGRFHQHQAIMALMPQSISFAVDHVHHLLMAIS